LGAGGFYMVGSPSNAVVTITEDSTALPVVTVTATVPKASTDGPVPGTFQFSRTGASTDSLTVYYLLGGTARNGADYQMLPGYVTIPAGATDTNITVTPIAAADPTGETDKTVALRLRPAGSMIDGLPHGASAYALGWPSNAVVNIAETAAASSNQ